MREYNNENEFTNNEVTTTTKESHSQSINNDSLISVKSPQKIEILSTQRSSPKSNITYQKAKWLNIPYFKIGRIICFYYPYSDINKLHDSSPFTWGPHYQMIVYIASFVVVIYLILYLCWWNYILSGLEKFFFFVMFIWCFLCYVWVSIINPGVILFNSKSIISTNDVSYCKSCQIYIDKEIEYRHCYSCEVCVEMRDHHCAAIGKCVGKGNIKWFYILIFWVTLLQGGSIGKIGFYLFKKYI